MQTVVLDKQLHAEVYGMASNEVKVMAVIKSRDGMYQINRVSRGSNFYLFQVLFLEVPEEVQPEKDVITISSFLEDKSTKTRIADFLGRSIMPQPSDYECMCSANNIIGKMRISTDVINTVEKYSQALSTVSERIEASGCNVNPQDITRFFLA